VTLPIWDADDFENVTTVITDTIFQTSGCVFNHMPKFASVKSYQLSQVVKVHVERQDKGVASSLADSRQLNRLLNTDVNHSIHMIYIILASDVRAYFSRSIED
jgi:hypothetical protein